jgi:hypothetical protein
VETAQSLGVDLQVSFLKVSRGCGLRNRLCLDYMCVPLRASPLHRVSVQRHMHAPASRASIHLMRTPHGHHPIAKSTTYGRAVHVNRGHGSGKSCCNFSPGHTVGHKTIEGAPRSILRARVGHPRPSRRVRRARLRFLHVFAGAHLFLLHFAWHKTLLHVSSVHDDASRACQSSRATRRTVPRRCAPLRAVSRAARLTLH